MMPSIPFFPAPRAVEERTGQFRFSTAIAASLPEGEFPFARRREIAELFYLHCHTAARLLLKDAGLPAHRAEIGEAAPVSLAEGDAYALSISERGVSLAGRTEQDLMYAFFTLFQCVECDCLDEGAEALYFPCMEIHDSPATLRRGFQVCIFPNTDLLMVEKAIRLAAFMKMNYLMVEFWGSYPFRCLPELHWADACPDEAEIRRLIALARALGMEIIPIFNHWGHAPMSRGRVGKHLVLDQNPRLAMLYEPDGWTWCLSNPATHRLLRDVREELMDLCGGGSYFHMGCDEASPFGSCPKCRNIDFIRYIPGYINGIAKEMEAHGRRVIVWGDQYLDSNVWKYPVSATSTGEYPTHEMLPHLSRNVIIADWQYRMEEPELPSTEYFMKEGFDVWPTSFDDVRQDFVSLARASGRLNTYGYMAATWNHLPSLIQILPEICSSAWQGDAYKKYPEQNMLTSALLRRVMPVAKSYAKAGFMPLEIDPMGYRTFM